MATELTPEAIEQLRRLDKAAHEGPWSFWPDYGIRPAPKYGRGTQLSFDGQEEMGANHALVIAMRNALPALLDAAERCAAAEAQAKAAGELLRAAVEAWPWVYGHPKQSDELWQAIAKAERAGIK